MNPDPTRPPQPFGFAALQLDAAAEAGRIEKWIHHTTARQLRRRGAVVAVSGGVDSAVCAALACRALGPERVLGLFLPERSTPGDAARRAQQLCHQLGIELVEIDIAPALAALGCYREIDRAARTVFPDHPDGARCKIALGGDLRTADRATLFDLVAEAPDGSTRRARMPLAAYLAIVAATNMKQRTRKLLEYTEAERRNFVVVGTPNRLEFEQGFFVRGGDGLADIKPIAHLYKTQVYALADYLDVPRAIREQPPSTDTYSLPQTQEEFFFALPYRELDLLLWARAHTIAPTDVATALGWSVPEVERALRDVESKVRAASRLHGEALRLSAAEAEEST